MSEDGPEICVSIMYSINIHEGHRARRWEQGIQLQVREPESHYWVPVPWFICVRIIRAWRAADTQHTVIARDDLRA